MKITFQDTTYIKILRFEKFGGSDEISSEAPVPRTVTV